MVEKGIHITHGSLRMAQYYVFSLGPGRKLVLEYGDPWPTYLDPSMHMLCYVGYASSHDAAVTASRF